MPDPIRTISLSLPYRMGRVNCYLLETPSGFILIDTGSSKGRGALLRKLQDAGCNPGHLDLIVLTHGDFDHSGNAAFLREQFGARIAMHQHDAGMVERGDMFFNRESGNALLRRIIPTVFRFAKSDRFKPDLYLDEGDELSEYGLDARVIRLLGHSGGSIGILTADGDLFCGDLLDNTKAPTLNSIMDDWSAGKTSVEKLKSLEIHTVYPGHGRPFAWELFMSSCEENGP
jgi:hydroxyacylglutathione hydrolase